MAKESNKTELEPTQEVAQYDATEIADNAPALFGYSKDMATAALAYSGIKRTSIEEARKVIKTFAERKVD